MDKKTERISIRIPSRLFQMIEELVPLHESLTGVILHILKNYEWSTDHEIQLEKTRKLRFETWFGEAKLKYKLEELEQEIKQEKSKSIEVK